MIRTALILCALVAFGCSRYVPEGGLVVRKSHHLETCSFRNRLNSDANVSAGEPVVDAWRLQIMEQGYRLTWIRVSQQDYQRYEVGDEWHNDEVAQ